MEFSELTLHYWTFISNKMIDLYKPIVHSKCLLPQDMLISGTGWGRSFASLFFPNQYLMNQHERGQQSCITTGSPWSIRPSQIKMLVTSIGWSLVRALLPPTPTGTWKETIPVLVNLHSLENILFGWRVGARLRLSDPSTKKMFSRTCNTGRGSGREKRSFAPSPFHFFSPGNACPNRKLTRFHDL